MNVKTHLANALESANVKSTYDEYVIRILSNNKMKQEKVFGDFQGKARYDILNVTFICLGDPTDEETPRFLSMLSTVLSDKIGVEEKKTILEHEYNIPMSRDLGREMEKMCNLSEAIEERGIEKGSKQNAKENAKKLLENGASYQLVRNSIENLTDEELQQIYDEVITNNEEK